MRNITIPSSVTWIGYGAFRNCRSLTSITIPNSVTSIHEFEFQGCISLTSINIPNSVTNIEGEAFYGCGNLTNITISGSVTKIGDNAFTNPFTGCTNATIYLKNEAMKQLLINSGVSASKIIVSA